MCYIYLFPEQQELVSMMSPESGFVIAWRHPAEHGNETLVYPDPRDEEYDGIMEKICTTLNSTLKSQQCKR